jgi:hypothetical protein
VRNPSIGLDYYCKRETPVNIDSKTIYTIRLTSEDLLDLLWNSGHEVPEMEKMSGRFKADENGLDVVFTYKKLGGT